MSTINRIIEIAQKMGIIRPKDLDEYGIPRRYLSRLYQRGILERTERGLYRLRNIDLTEHETLVKVSKRVESGIICLLSALRYHQVTTQQPFEVWLAIDRTSRRPNVVDLPIRIVRFSGSALSEGVEEHLINGIPIKIYNIAKTVADCFKYRNKIGLEVAIEALRECRRERKCSNDDLWYYSKICRVTNVIRPYLESMP